MEAFHDDTTVKAILDILGEMYPEPVSELQYRNSFELLIATILSAQATDRKVNEITPALFAKYSTPFDFAGLTAEELAQEIRSIHLCRVKAAYIIKTSRMLVSRYGGEVPRTREELIQLPGVGRKTANVVLSNEFHMPAIAVDTHVFRVANRLGLVDEKDVLKTELKLEQLLPREKWSDAHNYMVLHGRRVCHAKQPQCPACPLSEYCKYYKNP